MRHAALDLSVSERLPRAVLVITTRRFSRRDDAATRDSVRARRFRGLMS
jgi:hypothetical protein